MKYKMCYFKHFTLETCSQKVECLMLAGLMLVTSEDLTAAIKSLGSSILKMFNIFSVLNTYKCVSGRPEMNFSTASKPLASFNALMNFWTVCLKRRDVK